MSLALLRLQIVRDLDLGVSSAWKLGLHVGLLQDALAVVILTAGALAAGAVLGRWWAWVWSCLAMAVWLASLSGVVYFRVFGGLLDWWVVRYQYSDVPLVWSAAVQNGRFILGLVSGLLAILAVSALLRSGRRAARKSSVRLKDRLQLLALALAVLGLALGLHQARNWLLRSSDAGAARILTNQLVFDWLAAIRRSEVFEEPWDWRQESIRAASSPGRANSVSADDVTAVLADYRDGKAPGRLAESRSGKDPTRPHELHRRWDSVPGETAAQRAVLGLPRSEPINVLLLFVESLRSFELFHPEIGPLVYPRTRDLLRNHAIVFPQAYSSSFRAGQTVRGQFSTLCSMLPNMKGVATYIGYPGLRIRCIAETLKQEGYSTLWLSPFDKSHHNKYIFESTHGTEHFFDEIYFRGHGISKKVGEWGLADREFLETSFEVLEEFSKQPVPFFASLLTTTSHPPYSVVEEGRLPEDLIQRLRGTPEYLAYLSTMLYVDRSLDAFFERFFASEMARSTLVILVGDHSTAVRPHLDLSAVQLEEMRFRVPIALVTAGIEEAKEIRYPVHQVDIAPTIASVAGASDRVSWVGRSLLSGEGTPWVYEEGTVFHYRTGERACYTLVRSREVECYRAAEDVDPLFVASLEPVEEAEEETAFYREVVEAASTAIEVDVLVPERH